MTRTRAGGIRRLLGAVVRAVVYGCVGGFVVLVVVLVTYLEGRVDLSVWHEAKLDAEFTHRSGVDTLAEYQALEDALFAQLQERVRARIDDDERRLFNRYHAGSRSDPETWSPNWNRTFELVAERPVAGVLLLHGMSDSPYSMRGLAQRLHAAGAHVVGLRLPGHGTAPSGLVRVRARDMIAASRLGVRHLHSVVGERPLYIIGYSTGGALGVLYALDSLEDAALPPLDGLALMSPAVGVTPVAALAIWQARLGHLLGLRKLSWNSILPEYDPFKYNSFAVNAGDQVYRMTAEIHAKLDADGAAERLRDFPPVLAFQSVVDATVSTPALVEGLLDKLPQGDHELVLFDVNRLTEAERLLAVNPRAAIAAEVADLTRPYTLSLITNLDGDTAAVVVRQRPPGTQMAEEVPLGLAWPQGVYSLSHVAIPFAKDDPLYGGIAVPAGTGLWLGELALRGERGVLQIPASDMLRQRWNPFFPYLEQRVLRFVGAGGGGAVP